LSLRKILVTIDGSVNSKKAADYASSLAKKYNAQLIILYVFTQNWDLLIQIY